jgi:hypothetical protein
MQAAGSTLVNISEQSGATTQPASAFVKETRHRGGLPAARLHRLDGSRLRLRHAPSPRSRMPQTPTWPLQWRWCR